MIARRSRKRKPVWIVYVEGLMDKVKALSWKEKEKNAKLHQIGTPKRRRNLIRNTRLTGRKPLKKPLLAAGSSDSSDKID